MRPAHPKFSALLQFYHEHAAVALSAVHAPAGYTHSHPLTIAGQTFTGGEFIPPQVLAEATPAERRQVNQAGPAAQPQPAHQQQPSAVTPPARSKDAFTPPPGYGGHPWKGGTPEYNKVYNVPIEDIHRDPERFQYKQSTNQKGVTDQFAGVKFDPRYAGVLAVWQDPANRQTYVINGHHRLELAERTGGVPTMAVRYIKAKDAAEARAQGAIINMAGGKGTAMDAAKFMRETGRTIEDLKAENVSLKGNVAANGAILATLNDRLFSQVQRGQLPEETALAIARHLPNHNLQDQLANFLKKKEDAGKEYSPKVIDGMAREMAETPTHTTTEHLLFGDIEREDSLFGERNELKTAIRADLAKSVNDFKAVSSERRAGVVSSAGNTLNIEKNKETAERHAQALAVFDTLVNRKGPISDALNEGAKEYANAKNRKAKDAARNKTVDAVRAAVEAEILHPGAMGGPVPGSEGAPGSGGEELPGGTDDGERSQDEPDGLKPDAASKTQPTIADHLKALTTMTPEEKASHESSLKKYRDRVTAEGDWDSGNKTPGETKILNELAEKGVLTKRKGNPDEMTAGGIPTIYEPTKGSPSPAAASDAPETSWESHLAKLRTKPEKIAAFKDRLAGKSGVVVIGPKGARFINAYHEKTGLRNPDELIKRVPVQEGEKAYAVHGATGTDASEEPVHILPKTPRPPMTESQASTLRKSAVQEANDFKDGSIAQGIIESGDESRLKEAARARCPYLEGSEPAGVWETAFVNSLLNKPTDAPLPSPAAGSDAPPAPLPDGWSIQPHDGKLGLFRAGRDTPVAIASTREALTARIHGANQPKVADENTPKSKGHVAFVGKHEYYRGADGRLYKATIGGKINPKTGNRTGNLSSDKEMEKAQAKATMAPASAGQAERQPDTAQPAPKASLNEMMNAAKAYQFLAAKEEPEDSAGRQAVREHQSHATKAALDQWLMKRYGIDAAEARNISNAIGEEHPSWYTSDGHVMWRPSNTDARGEPIPEPTGEGMDLPWRKGKSAKPAAPSEPADNGGRLDYANVMKIAADSVQELRKQDVHRVMDAMQNAGDLAGMGKYITTHRPELQGEVDEVAKDIAAERGYAGQGATKSEAAPSSFDPLDIDEHNLKSVWEHNKQALINEDKTLSPNGAGNIAAARILNAIDSRAGDYINKIDARVKNGKTISDEEDAKYIRAGEMRRNLYNKLVDLSGYRPGTEADEDERAKQPIAAPAATSPAQEPSAGKVSTDRHGDAAAIDRLPSGTDAADAPHDQGSSAGGTGEAAQKETPQEEVSQDVPSEARPKEPKFTGTTTDSLGRVYHWVDGVRVPGPQDPAAAEDEPANESIAESLGKAAQATHERQEKYGKALDGLPDGTKIKSGQRVYTKETVDGEVFWKKESGRGKQSHLSSRQAFVDMGHKAADKAIAEASNEHKLAGPGEASDGGGLPAGEQLGKDAATAPGEVLPGTGEGAGEGPGSVHRGENLRGDTVPGADGGAGDTGNERGGDSAGATPVGAPGGPADDQAVRADGGSGAAGSGSDASPAQQSLSQPPTPENPTDLAAGNFHYGELDFAGKGLKTKFRQNIEAIRTLKAIELEGRTTATPAEQEILAKYVGWGQFPGIFKTYGDEGFNENERQEWKQEAKILQSLLSSEEYRAARGSILNAHYTHPDVVKLHWDIAQRLGFKGGRFLETSAGIGYYLGMMPGELASRTHASAVELDTITGKMLSMLYPSANVQVQGFEKYKCPDNFYDLIASNVPFGDYKIHEPEYNKLDPLIHDHFFLKSVDKVRPGGLVMHITSAGTMDKANSKIREELAKQCDLVSAFRMPDTTHKENAGTEVVTDMIILRKRAPGEKPSGPNWMKTVEVPCPRSTSDPTGGKPLTVNEYFAEHPEQILGELNRTGKLYGGDQKNVSLTDDYEERLRGVIDRLPTNIMSEPPPSQAFQPQPEPAPGDLKPGGYTINDGKLFRSEEGMLVEQKVTPANLERIQGHLEIRDALRAVIKDQREGVDATAAREKLNQVYDAYVKKNGFLNTQANKRAFRDDPDSPLVRALENWNNEKKTATKADMFSKDTIRRDQPVTHADTISDALAATLHTHGRIDVDHMAKLLGHHPDHVKKAMIAEGVAFEEPGEGFKPADQYLAGNVRKKLTMARAAAASDPRYQANVAALEKVQPEDIDHSEISARLGSHWIPGTDIAAFAAHLLGGKPSHFDIKYVPALGSWKAYYTNAGQRELKDTAAAKSVWGVQIEQENGQVRQVAGFLDILKAALSGKSMTIKDKVTDDAGNEREVVNAEATDACRAKVQEMRDAFCGEAGDGWVWEDDERRARLHRYYNDNFNNIRHTEYNGSHLTFPGMNPAIKLHPHIPNFVWQVVTTGKGLAAHEVGTGKTYSMIASAMELRRLGLAKKPCIACLKANVEAITADVLKLYPGAKVLSTADMFTAEKRKQTLSQIATGDYDVVVMTHDNLNMLPMRPETEAKYIQEELDDLREAMRAAESEEAQSSGRGGKKRSLSVKAMENQEKKLIAKLQGALDSHKDDTVYFEDLGIDQLFVDECFPGETRVATDRGLLTIAEIVENRLSVRALTCDRATHSIEYRPVVSWFKRPLRNHLVRVIHENGSFVCTPNHNIWTEEEGYVQAGLLQGHHTLRLVPDGVRSELGVPQASETLFESVLRQGAIEADSQEMPTLWQGVHQTGQAWRRTPPVLLQGLREEMVLVGPRSEGAGHTTNTGGHHGRIASSLFRTHETEESHVEARDAREDAAIHAWQDILSQGRQRGGDGAAAITGVRPVLADGVSHRDGAGEGSISVAAELLQSRYGESCPQDRGGSGRDFASPTEMEVPGQEEDGSAVFARVVCVALHQRAGDDRTIDGAEGSAFVYDIEVADHHNYFADGVNVSNSHAYKTLPVYTKMDRVKGVPTGRSQRATNMLMRTRWLQEQNGGRGVVFATGTPVSNTLAEMYTNQRYLQPEALKERGIDKFDAWANLFGEVRTKHEWNVAGQYAPATRFASFVNLPELKQIATEVIDVRRADDIRKKPADVPEEARPKQENFTGVTQDKDGREYQWTDGTTPAIPRPNKRDKAIAAENTPAIAAHMASLTARAEAIKKRSGPPQKGDDNMLVICTDGRKAALDMRLVDPHAKDDPKSKTNLAVANILKIHKERPGQVQLIFSDIGINPQKMKGAESRDDDEEEDLDAPDDTAIDETGLRWYGDVIDKLVKGGIPREKIADFSKLKGQEKEDAQAALRRGDMVIGIGSTQKMGTGVNVQNKITAMHHLDVPWIPAAIEQRVGRGYRFGNENKDVDNFTYVTEGSLDKKLWEVVGTKANFINQFFNPDSKQRRMENKDTEQLSPQEISAIASGDPRQMERVTLEQEIKDLRRAQSRHDRDQVKLKKAEEATAGRVKEFREEAEERGKDVEHLKAYPDFHFEIDDVAHTERETAKDAFAAAKEQAEKRHAQYVRDHTYGDYGHEEPIGTYRGMEVYRKGPVGGSVVYVRTPTGKEYETSGSLQGLDIIGKKIARAHADVVRDADQADSDLAKIRAQMDKKFTKSDDIAKKAARIKEIDDQLAAESRPKDESDDNPTAAKKPSRKPHIPKRAFSVDDEVRDALQEAKVKGNTVVLPKTLDRNLYEKVNKVLEAAGGIWNRKAGAHVFPADPQRVITTVAETGRWEPPADGDSQDVRLSALMGDISDEVRAEALRALRAHFPLSDYSLPE